MSGIAFSLSWRPGGSTGRACPYDSIPAPRQRILRGAVEYLRISIRGFPALRRGLFFVPDSAGFPLFSRFFPAGKFRDPPFGVHPSGPPRHEAASALHDAGSSWHESGSEPDRALGPGFPPSVRFCGEPPPERAPLAGFPPPSAGSGPGLGRDLPACFPKQPRFREGVPGSQTRFRAVSAPASFSGASSGPPAAWRPCSSRSAGRSPGRSRRCPRSSAPPGRC